MHIAVIDQMLVALRQQLCGPLLHVKEADRLETHVARCDNPPLASPIITKSTRGFAAIECNVSGSHGGHGPKNKVKTTKRSDSAAEAAKDSAAALTLSKCCISPICVRRARVFGDERRLESVVPRAVVVSERSAAAVASVAAETMLRRPLAVLQRRSLCAAAAEAERLKAIKASLTLLSCSCCAAAKPRRLEPALRRRKARRRSLRFPIQTPCRQ